MFLLGMFVLIGAGCTSGASAPSTPATKPTSTTTTTTLAAGVAADAYVACLGENGVDVDSIRLDANGRPQLDLVNSQLDYSDPQTVEAISACAELLAAGALDLGSDESLREGVMAQLRAFSRCVRARGVTDFPDPIPGFIGVGSPFPVAEIPYSHPDLPAAAAACQETVFGAFPGSGG